MTDWARTWSYVAVAGYAGIVMEGIWIDLSDPVRQSVTGATRVWVLIMISVYVLLAIRDRFIRS